METEPTNVKRQATAIEVDPEQINSKPAKSQASSAHTKGDDNEAMEVEGAVGPTKALRKSKMPEASLVSTVTQGRRSPRMLTQPRIPLTLLPQVMTW